MWWERAGRTLQQREEGDEGIDTEKERIICLIHERLWLSARSSRWVPPLMIPPFFFLFLALLIPRFCFIFEPTFFFWRCALISRLIVSLVPRLLLASVPHRFPSVFSSLPSINFFLPPHLLPFPIQYFLLVFSQMYTPASTHTLLLMFSSFLPSVSGFGCTLPSPPERVSSLHVKRLSWEHVDLLYPLPGITIFAHQSVKQKSCPARPFCQLDF